MLDKNSTMVKYGVSLLVGFFSFFFLFYLSAILLESRLPESIKLEDGWEVAVNGTSYTKPLLSDVHFPIVSTGDVVTLTRSLSNYPIPNPVLRVHAWYSIVDISLNGLQVYSYGHEIAAEGMRLLASQTDGDAQVVSGESGAAGAGLALSVLKYQELAWLKEKLGLNENSVLLFFSTEGDTDQENYKRIVKENAWSVNFSE